MTAGDRFANCLIEASMARGGATAKYSGAITTREAGRMARATRRGLRNKWRRSGIWIDASAGEEGFLRAEWR